ncbi:MAG: hypothetical protein Q7W45_00965 [Bacteroidota bacterium]|jgi:hypothetical protein|nr:hypothetical protein [Bacteroidota bacterium]MDP3146669.1 hypothetical protein [Bacteroidota bacterium]
MSNTAKVVVMEQPFKVRPCNKKELYNHFKVSKHIFNRWIKAIEPQLGKPIGGLYSVKQVLFIIETYGTPCQIVNEAA